MRCASAAIDWLPHGQGFRLISEIGQCIDGKLTTTMHWLPGDHPLADHFPNGPRVVPGVLLGEQVAQSSLLLAMMEGVIERGELVLLASLRCDFPATAEAPCMVSAEVELQGAFRGRFAFFGRCTVDGRHVARVKGLAMRPPNA